MMLTFESNFLTTRAYSAVDNIFVCKVSTVCKVSAQCRQFQEEAKEASVSECTWTLSALEALRNALYKLKTYLLTYLLY